MTWPAGLLIQLNRGELPGRGARLFSNAVHEAMWQPVLLPALDPLPPSLKATQPLINTYALGGDVRDYRGTKIIWHGRALCRFKAAKA